MRKETIFKTNSRKMFMLLFAAVLYFGSFSVFYSAMAQDSITYDPDYVFSIEDAFTFISGSIVNLIQSNDGGYVGIGSFNSTDWIIEKTDGTTVNLTSNGGSDIFVIKLDSELQVVDAVRYGGTGQETTKAILNTDDGGYVVTGYFNSTDWIIEKTDGTTINLASNGDYDIFVIKLNSELQIMNAVSYGGTKHEFPHVITNADDGEYVIAGRFTSTDWTIEKRDGTTINIPYNGDQDIFVIKLDNELQIVDTGSCGGASYVELEEIINANDGGYVITGNFYASYSWGKWTIEKTDGTTINLASNGGYDIFVIKLNKDLQVENAICFAGTGEEKYSNIVYSDQAGYIIIGQSRSSDFSIKKSDGTSITLNKNGNIFAVKLGEQLQYEETFFIGGDLTTIYLNNVVKIDGGYTICGYFNNRNPVTLEKADGMNAVVTSKGYWDVFVIKLNEKFQIEDIITFGGSGADYVSSFTNAIDGGYIIIGSGYMYGQSTYDLTLEKSDGTIVTLYLNSYDTLFLVKLNDLFSKNFDFSKSDKKDYKNKLANAQFIVQNEAGLYMIDEKNLKAGQTEGLTFGNKDDAKIFTSDENGAITINFKRTGIYYLEEIQSPEYYRKNPYSYIVTVGKNSIEVVEADSIVYSEIKNIFDGRLTTEQIKQNDENMKDPEQTNYTVGRQEYNLLTLLDKDHIVHSDMDNTPATADFTIEKEAEWMDIAEGKAKITMTVTRPPLYQDKREKDTIAVYAFTACTAHGFSDTLAQKNIFQLLDSYDYIDVVVVTAPVLDPDGDGEVNMNVYEKQINGVPNHDGTWILQTDSCPNDSCIPGVKFWKEVNKNDVNEILEQINFAIQQHYGNALPAALTSYFAERERTNNLPSVVYTSLDRVNLTDGPNNDPRRSDALKFAFEYSEKTWEKLQKYASTDVSEDNPKGLSHYFVLTGDFSSQEESIEGWHVLASLFDPSIYNDPMWKTINLEEAREFVKNMKVLPYSMDFHTLNIDVNPDFNQEKVERSILIDTLSNEFRINHVEWEVNDADGKIDQLVKTLPYQNSRRILTFDLSDIDVSDTVNITIYVDTVTRGKVGDPEWIDTNSGVAALTEIRRYNYDILDPVSVSTESPALAQIAISYTGKEVEPVDGSYIIVNSPIMAHSFTIKKVDDITREALAGAVFCLSGTTDDGSDITDESVRLEYAGLFRGSDEDERHNYEPTIKTVTDENGLAVFENLPEGSYFLTETQAPAGYDAEYEDIEVVIISAYAPDDVTIYGMHQDSGTGYWIAENPKTQNITIKKVDAETGDALPGAVFEINWWDAEKNQAVMEEKTTDDKGLIVLNSGSYTIKEIQAPTGYAINPDTWIVSSEDEDRILTVEDAKKAGEITVTKKWEDGLEYIGAMGRPHPHIVLWGYDEDGNVVYQNSTTNDEKKWVKMEEEPWDIWTYTFDIRDPDLAYKAWEEGNIEKYVNTYNDGNPISVSLNDQNIITNSVETIDISGKKIWDDQDNLAGKRPDELTISVYGEDKSAPAATMTVSEATGWKWNFTGLPKYNAGEEIEYSITENVIDEYQHEHDGYNIINTYTPGKIELSVSKTWDDDHNRDGVRPDSITVKLFADGVDIGRSETISGASTVHFRNLDEWRNGQEGEKIVYSVVEDPVPAGYTAQVTATDYGFNVTNTHEPEVTSLSGIKVWDDKNDQDGIRPDEVTIYLWAQGEGYNEVVKHTTAKASEGWIWSFEDLYVNKDGKPVTYSVSEVSEEDTDGIEGYTSVVNGTVITNIHVPVATDIEVYKEWDDNHDEDGIRPEKVTVELLANGAGTGKTAELNAENHWHAEFQNLDVDSDGVEIVYSVKEMERIRGYKSEFIERDGELILINIHTPGTIDIPVTKVWVGGSEANRPVSIVVKLYQDGEEAETLVLNAENEWQGDFINLPKDAEYSIEEAGNIEGYTTVIIGDAETGFVITNMYEEPDEPPVPPVFYRVDEELPRTGLTGVGVLGGKPAAVSYVPVGMELMIPSLGVNSEIVRVAYADGGYPVEWLGMDAGLLADSALPGEGVSVIAAHNTLNAEEYGPFALISELGIGDRFFVRTDRELKSFMVYANEKIGGSDGAALASIAMRYENSLTLLTCEDERPEGGYASRRVVAAREIRNQK